MPMWIADTPTECALSGEPAAAVAERSRLRRRNPRRAQVEQQIGEVAARLFSEQGFASTSLQDIANAMGMTRTALYHYVANKDELLARLLAETTETPAELLRSINERAHWSPVKRLREMATAIASHQMQRSESFRLMVCSEAELPPALVQKYRQSQRDVLRNLTAVIEEGIDAGEVRPIDPRTSALGVIGMLNWTAWWHRPGNAVADRITAAQLVDMVVRAVTEDALESLERAPGPKRVIATLREQLDHLEQLVEEQRP